jgi:hypothetical protein
MEVSYQIKFFERLQEFYPRKGEIIDKLSELLHIKKDGIYRRIRGETILSVDELMVLAKAHRISVDNLLDIPKNDVVFTFNSFSNSIKEVDDYVENLSDLLKEFSKFGKSQLYYASCEIPIFYYCLVPDVFAFKLYVWARTVWNLDYFQNVSFSPDMISADTRLHVPELFNLYKQIPTLELWSYNIFDNTLSQIEYHFEGNMFKDGQIALDLCDGLMHIQECMRQMAAHSAKFGNNGSKESGSELKLYHNEMIYTNNTLLFHHPYGKTLFTTFCNPNFIMSNDQRIADFSENWFKTIINKSSLISGQNEKARNKFFDSIKRKIEQSKNRIMIYMDQYH